MRLAKLTVAGFKSFADPTEFHFSEPVIGIVGPNGCGKSNVVDAIKWVLGERSAKSLRGSAMLDVIFAGCASRKPMGGASVTLTFENPIESFTEEDAHGTTRTVQRRALGIDTEEVDVTRRLFSDGKSEYLINGGKVRLRDIKELFLDTGIGTNAYSIIEQGKVDAMLLANPVERRLILEEAAGVAKFRTRKLEATRKLEHAEKNLLLVREQLSNTERRLRIVRGQAAKAEQFQDLDARRQDLMTSVFLERYHDLNERLHGLTNRVSEVSKERTDVQTAVTDLEDTKQQSDIERQELQNEQHGLEQRRLELHASEKQARQRSELTGRNLEEALQQLAQEEARIAENDESLSGLAERLEALELELVALNENQEHAERVVAACEEERAKTVEQATKSRAEVDRLKDDASRIERDTVGAEGLLASLDEREQALQEQITRLDARIVPFALEADHHRVELVRARSAHASASDRLEKLSQDLEQHSTIEAELDDRQTELLGQLARVREERSAMNSRRHALAEVHSGREGLGNAVKHVLEHPDRFPGVHGLLGDLIETDRDHAELVESALGDDLQALLVDSTGEIDEMLQELRALDGRIVLLPVNPTNQAAPTPRTTVPGATPLISMVKAEGPARIVLERRLSDTWLVDSLQTARRMAQDQLPNGRFVTHTGERFDPDERIVIAPTAREDAAQGWLSRKAELRELDELLGGTNQEVETLEANLADIEQESGTAVEQRVALSREIEETRNKLVELSHEIERTEQMIERVQRDRESILNEKNELENRFEGMRQEEAERREQLQSLNRLLAEQRDAVLAAECTARDNLAASERAREELAGARVTQGESNARLEAARREQRHLALSREEAERQVAIGREQLDRRKGQVARFKQTIASAEHEITETTEALASMSDAFAELAQRSEQAASNVTKATEALHSARAHGAQIERDLHALEMSRREIEIKRETLEERAIEELEFEIPNKYPDYARARNEGQEPIDVYAAEAEATELKEQIRKLGNVNLDAIEELDALQVRNEDLEQQLQDIDSAREQLEALIEELDIVSRARFQETFETVRDAMTSGDCPAL